MVAVAAVDPTPQERARALAVEACNRSHNYILGSQHQGHEVDGVRNPGCICPAFRDLADAALAEQRKAGRREAAEIVKAMFKRDMVLSAGEIYDAIRSAE